MPACPSRTIRGRLGVFFARAPRLDLVSRTIQNANSFCPFGPSQRPREPPDPRLDRFYIGSDLHHTSDLHRAIVVLPVAQKLELEDHADPFGWPRVSSRRRRSLRAPCKSSISWASTRTAWAMVMVAVLKSGLRSASRTASSAAWMGFELMAYAPVDSPLPS